MVDGWAWAQARLGWMHSRRLERLQSGIVLPTARTLYLIGALVCALATVVAVFIALYFQVAAWSGADRQDVPEVPAAAAPTPTLNRLEVRLTGPTSLRFAADAEADSVSAGQMLGHFEADSANGLALYPRDFEILGGKDAELFQTGYHGGSGRTGLTATPALAAAMEGAPSDRRFIVRVLARDAFGNRSPPTDVTFSLAKPAAAAAAVEDAPVTELGGSGSLPKIARALAAKVAATGTPEFFDAYKFALAAPERCGAPEDAAFIDLYRAAVIQYRPRLSAENIDAFYAGLCDSWEEAAEASRRTVANAEAERQRVIAQNAAAVMAAEAASSSARLVRNAALGFAFSAVLAFMMIGLFLAFMAIEGHSAAVRRAVELLAVDKENRDDA